MTQPLHTEIDRARLREVARVRVLVADTDTTGIVYHASYLRYLELARVELIRAAGLPYRVLEAAGLALPLTDIAVRYRAPAKHDDFMTIEAGLVLLTRVRVAFQYVVAIAPGDRHGLDARLELLTAETRHACVRLADGRPERLPAPVYELLESCYRNAGGVRGAGP